MAFLDDINKMFSNAGKKTKDMADTAKINSAINEEEKKIYSCYYQIGKLYVSLHPEDYQQEFSGMMHQIADGEAKIAELKNKIKVIKGIKQCPRCGADVGLNSLFCSACGFEMPKEETENENIICVTCGKSVNKESKFCIYCGNPICNESPAEKVEDLNEESEEITEATVETEIDFIVCSDCGAKLSNDCVFCIECGKKLTDN